MSLLVHLEFCLFLPFFVVGCRFVSVSASSMFPSKLRSNQQGGVSRPGGDRLERGVSGGRGPSQRCGEAVQPVATRKTLPSPRTRKPSPFVVELSRRAPLPSDGVAPAGQHRSMALGQHVILVPTCATKKKSLLAGHSSVASCTVQYVYKPAQVPPRARRLSLVVARAVRPLMLEPSRCSWCS